MKRVIFLAMHGAGGAGGEGDYSPDYPWSADNELQDFMNIHMILDPRLFNSLFRGLYWKGVLEAGLHTKKSGRFEDVQVICTKGDIGSKSGKWFAINALQTIMNCGDDVILIPVGKSMGGFHILEVIDFLDDRYWRKSWRKRTGTITIPSALLIDPDNFFLPDPNPACVIPGSIGEVTVIRQNNPNLKTNFLPAGIRGRVMARKNGSFDGITDFCFPTPPLTFPETDPNFTGLEVTHWTIDEYMVLHGHPKTGTIGEILERFVEKL